MVLNFLGTILRTKSFSRVFVKKFAYQVDGLFTMIVIEIRILGFNLVVNLESFFGVEGWYSGQHFIYHTTKTPPITWVRIALFV